MSRKKRKLAKSFMVIILLLNGPATRQTHGDDVSAYLPGAVRRELLAYPLGLV